MSDIQTPPGTEEVKPDTITPGEPGAATQPKPEDTVDFWKKKFADSTREAQILAEADRQRQMAAQELTKEPTDSEVRAAFPEWDSMSDLEKRMARETVAAKRMATSATALTKQMQDDRTWSNSIEIAVSSDPALQGKEFAFRQFASKPQYRNVPMEVLVPAFLQQSGAAQTPRPTPRPGLEPGTGGPKTPEKPKQLDADELKALRKTDEKAYLEYIKTHDIEID